MIWRRVPQASMCAYNCIVVISNIAITTNRRPYLERGVVHLLNSSAQLLGTGFDLVAVTRGQDRVELAEGFGEGLLGLLQMARELVGDAVQLIGSLLAAFLDALQLVVDDLVRLGRVVRRVHRVELLVLGVDQAEQLVAQFLQIGVVGLGSIVQVDRGTLDVVNSL